MKISTQKTQRVLKLRKKVPSLVFNPLPESDYLLENTGNFREFLSPIGEYTLDTNLEKGQILRHNIIGPTSAFQLMPIDTPTQKLFRKSSHQPTIKTTRQSIIITKVDYQARFNEVMSRINSALSKARTTEKAQESENLLELPIKPLISLTKKPSVQQKSPNNKPEPNINNHLSWYMSLRECPESQNIDSYMRIGAEMNGLYTKVSKPNPNFKSPISQNPSFDNFDDLIIKGKNKLELEIEAVKKVGIEFLRPELLELSPMSSEEIIVLNYSQSENSKIKKLNK